MRGGLVGWPGGDRCTSRCACFCWALLIGVEVEIGAGVVVGSGRSRWDASAIPALGRRMMIAKKTVARWV